MPEHRSFLPLIDAELISRNLVDALGIERLGGAEPKRQLDTSSFQNKELQKVTSALHDFELDLIGWSLPDPLAKPLSKSGALDDVGRQCQNKRAGSRVQDFSNSLADLSHRGDQGSGQFAAFRNWVQGELYSPGYVMYERIPVPLFRHAEITGFIHWMYHGHMITPAFLTCR